MSFSIGIDLTPLRTSAQYRRLFIAGFVTSLGSQATYVTMPYQLKQLTHSPLDVGSLGLAELLPLIVFGLYGGVLADRVNRRVLIITLEVLMMMVTAGTLLNALQPHPQAWVLYVAAFIFASFSSLQSPSIAALNQSLVSHEMQKSASALGVTSRTIASIIGPALGGLAAVAVGPAFIYSANLITFSASIFLLWGLAAHVPTVTAHASDRDALREGVRFLRSRADIVGTYIIDFVAMIFAFPVAMLPFVAAHYHETYALSVLYCGLPIGALIATLLSKWTHGVHHYGRAIAASAALWGLGIAVFGFCSPLPIVFGGLVLAGGADAFSALFRITMWNESIPPAIRGRMGGMEMISYTLGPTAGQFRAGVMAAWTSLRFALTVGGLTCTGAVGVVMTALPTLWRFDARTNVDVAAVRAIRMAEHDGVA